MNNIDDVPVVEALRQGHWSDALVHFFYWPREAATKAATKDELLSGCGPTATECCGLHGLRGKQLPATLRSARSHCTRQHCP